MTIAAAKIRELNDKFRRELVGGTVLLTPGVAALGRDVIGRVVRSISIFDDFCNANDPYEEHDFGSIEVDGNTIFFKIDYYDKTLTAASSDPTNPNVTERIITIMMSSEY